MAYQTVGTYRIYEHEQEEIIEKNLVADPDTGIVEEVTTLVQPYIHIWADLVVQQELLNTENRSNIYAYIQLYASAAENSTGCEFEYYRGRWATRGDTAIQFCESSYEGAYYSDSKVRTFSVAPGETASKTIMTFDSTSAFPFNKTNTVEIDDLYHDFEGNLTIHEGYSSGYGYYLQDNIDFNARFYAFYTGNFNGTEVEGKDLTGSQSGIIPTYLPTNRGVNFTTADSFTDEENPSITYSVVANYFQWDSSPYKDYSGYIKDTITSVQVGLSFDGETLDIPYREISTGNTSYTFNLTDAERELLRQKAQGAPTVPIYYITKTARYKEANSSDHRPEFSQEFISKVQRYFTVVGCNPSINPTVMDIKEETIALTGDVDTVVRYESMVEFAVNATASKNATIVSQSVTCGSKTVSGLEYGIIDDVESGFFTFKATDSRNLTAEKVVQKNLIEYVKPTCYQKLEIALSGETGANIGLTVNGNYFNGSFGAVDNTLKLEVRHTDDDGNMGEWQTIPGTPTFNGNTYKLEATFGGFNYGNAYIFQCRATDKLNIVQSSQYTIRLLPVFDWSEEDFNFNVPIQMNGETVLRHNREAKNTVLSASGGHIYIRPGGTDDTSGELMIKPDGDVTFGGEVEVNEVATFNGDVNLNGAVMIDGVDLNEILQPGEEVPMPADYITAIGTEAMGSNGTWYWIKWNSGKAECYGKRNFGKMAITTAKVDDVYRSATQTQTLPSGLFVAAPEFININTYADGGTYQYCWVGNDAATAASTTSTGGFVVMSCKSQTTTSTTLTFNIIGRWK